MATAKTRPYWLDGGTERCEFCDHPYVLQHEYRCALCDAASCEQCVTIDRETGQVRCHECPAHDGEGEG